MIKSPSHFNQPRMVNKINSKNFEHAFAIVQKLDNKDSPLHKNPRSEEILLQCIHSISNPQSLGWDKVINISRTLHGLHKTAVSSNIVKILSHLTKRITELPAQWDGKNIVGALYGLQGMDATTSTVQALLAALTVKINAATDQFNAQAIGSVLYGLQRMNVTTPAVQALLAALTDKINVSQAPLAAQNIGMALYGLQNMDATTPAVQALLATLTDKINAATDKLSAQAIGMALYGLQRMSAASFEMEYLLEALTFKINVSTDELNAQAIGNALYGLQNMDAVTPAVQAVLAALTNKIHTSQVQLGAQEIGNALYGLQRMDAVTPAVQAVLAALTNKIHTSQAQLGVREIGMALYGLQRMNETSFTVQDLFQVLKKKISASSVVLNTKNKNPVEQGFFKQVVVGYLGLKDTLGFEPALIKTLFPDVTCVLGEGKTLSAIETKKLFINYLIQHHYQDGVMNLHDLDYASAIMLLTAKIKQEAYPTQIICGIGVGHKKSSAHKMHNIVQAYLVENMVGIRYVWQQDGGAVFLGSTVMLDKKRKHNSERDHSQYFYHGDESRKVKHQKTSVIACAPLAYQNQSTFYKNRASKVGKKK